jgi:hypothetical protein
MRISALRRVGFALAAVLATTGARAAAAPVPAHFRDGLIFVTVEVGGADGLFLLDTGAAATVFDPRFARGGWRRARPPAGRRGARRGGCGARRRPDTPSPGRRT